MLYYCHNNMNKISPEDIQKNWNRYVSLLTTKTGSRSDSIKKFLDVFEQKLSLAPASHKGDYHNCFVGGLVDHSLRVLNNAITLNNAFGYNLNKESLVLCSLFHDLGKVGDEDSSYYLPQVDSWKAEKYQEYYMINRDMQYMSVSDRTLYLCQKFNIELSKEEFLTLKLADGHYVEENSSYKLKEPTLAVVIHMADLLATREEKGLDLIE